MPDAIVDATLTLNGRTYRRERTVTDDGVIEKHIAAVAAAKTGQLTTRTDANTGTLTMSSGHGITTGARLDVYWSGGSRRGMTVGTVATNSVPIDGGSGDDLPANLTSVTAAVPREESFALVGDDAEAVATHIEGIGTIVFAASDNSELHAVVSTATDSYWWTSADAATNPLASDTVAKVFMSHSSSSATAVMRAAALFS